MHYPCGVLKTQLLLPIYELLISSINILTSMMLRHLIVVVHFFDANILTALKFTARRHHMLVRWRWMQQRDSRRSGWLLEGSSRNNRYQPRHRRFGRRRCNRRHIFYVVNSLEGNKVITTTFCDLKFCQNGKVVSPLKWTTTSFDLPPEGSA